MIVDPETHLICMGDFNARMTTLEPNIRYSDTNGQMIEKWTLTNGMHHLNQQPTCNGVYTFGKSEKARNAIDHVLVNDIMIENFTLETQIFKYRG